jgi:hypothetical protein
MTDQVWKLLAAAGAIVFGVGLYLGFSRIEVPALDGTQDCGSAFRPSGYSLAGSFVVGECDSKRQDRKTEAVVALIIGGGIGAYSASQHSGPMTRARDAGSPLGQEEADG